MDWVSRHWLDLLALVVTAGGVWWLMPRRQPRAKVAGLTAALVGTALWAWRLRIVAGPIGETLLFSSFAGAAILSAILMITNRNPVYSALWFAMATLATCGLFLLQYAPFLAAATVIVYAGAIVVTFVFVIMLAQPSGATVYDQRSHQPLLSTVAAFVLLTALLGTLQTTRAESAASAGAGDLNATVAAAAANPLSQPARDESLGAMHPLGRSLMGDYLFAVELAGTLLLVATIGAIAIAPRRRRGTL
jgi:NADH-quinone oxidoreductase subunit J